MAKSLEPPPITANGQENIDFNSTWILWFENLYEVLRSYLSIYGILVPQITTAQRDAITNPANGLLIYNTTTNAPEMYIASAWHSISYT